MGKVFKRFLIAFLAVACIACIGAAAACKKETEYFTLTYVADDCVTIESEAQSGALVPKNREISFSLVIAEGAEGVPYVDVNGTELVADANGVYTFKMTGNTTVTVSGVAFMNVYTVTFDRHYTVKDDNGKEYSQLNDFIYYLDTDGNVIETADVVSGESISFRLHTSVYYGDSPEYTVRAGSKILDADDDGVYTFGVAGDTKVTVTGLTNLIGENSFLNREDGGEGTAEKPYLIREPADLYVMADRIEDEFYIEGWWQTAYYKLENDIDLKGEQLFVIGHTLSSVAVFMGTFDGNGKTIKNYKITNKIVEQSGLSEVNLPYVGLFGFAALATIYNLNLENFTIEVDGIKANNTYAGAVVGYARGVNIQNCTANGKILMQGSDEQTSFIGGIAGAIQSYFDDDGNYPASVQSCSTDVEIGVLSGAIYSAGGIAGVVSTSEERVTASVLNCYAEGDVYGAMRAGGIVGQLSTYSSIKNCYATGEIEADNYITLMIGAEFFSYAYAGGIAAYAEFGSIISDSFFTGGTYASAVAGANYQRTGGIVAEKDEDGTDYIFTDGAVVYNCYAEGDKGFSTSNDFIKGTLGWSSEDWKFGNGLPEINRDYNKKTFTVTVMVDGKKNLEWNISDYYASMGYWYLYNSSTLGSGKEEGIPEFIGTGNRTYGYYFDEDCTVKVPFGYILTDDITIYAKTADYGEVAGTYYLQGKSGYIRLTDDGYLYYRDGALNVLSTYVYNGDYAILYNTFLAILADTENDFYTFKAKVTGNVMTIYDYDVYPEDAALKAVKKVDGFRYGSYYDAQNNEYIFNEDGTGVEKLANGTQTRFTFTADIGCDITVKYGDADRVCTVNSDGLVTSFNNIEITVYDAFKGVWESAAGVNEVYSFDGMGNWTYKRYDYRNGEEVILASANGEYEIDGGVLTLDTNGIKFEFDGQFIKAGGETFYKQNSFVGTWSFKGRLSKNEPIEITFGGIGTSGYGKAKVTYPVGEPVEVDYSSVELNGNTYVLLYFYYTEWGLLTLDKTNYTLTGSFYSNLQGTVIDNVIFCLHDGLTGEWDGKDGALVKSLRFDGLGKYDIKGSANCLETKGYVYVNGNTGVRYTLDEGSLSGSFTYDNKQFTFTYDKENDVVTVYCEDDSQTLERKADGRN